MALMKDYTIEGLSDVMKLLEELPIKVQTSILKTYLRGVAKRLVVDVEKLRLAYSTETERNIIVQNVRNNPLAVQAGPTTDSYWLRFADRGTKLRNYKGKNRGSIRGKNQIEQIVLGQINPIIKDATENIGNEINKIIEKRIRHLDKINSKK